MQRRRLLTTVRWLNSFFRFQLAVYTICASLRKNAITKPAISSSSSSSSSSAAAAEAKT
jgi:hypothetical protein